MAVPRCGLSCNGWSTKVPGCTSGRLSGLTFEEVSGGGSSSTEDSCGDRSENTSLPAFVSGLLILVYDDGSEGCLYGTVVSVLSTVSVAVGWIGKKSDVLGVGIESVVVGIEKE